MGVVLYEVGGVSVVKVYGFLEGDSAGEFGCELARTRKGLRGDVLTSFSCVLLLEAVASGYWLLLLLGIANCFFGLSGPFDPRELDTVLLHGNVAERPTSKDLSSEGFMRGLGGGIGFLTPDFGLEPTLVAAMSLPLVFGD